MSDEREYRGILDEWVQEQRWARDQAADQWDNERGGVTGMPDEEIAAIRARVAAATAGPWFYDAKRGSIETERFADDVVAGDGWGDGVCNDADSEFIARARTDIPALLAEIERLRSLLQREHDARLEICREAETLLRERDAAEATITELRHVGREQGDMMARLTGGTIERLERENAALRQALQEVIEFSAHDVDPVQIAHAALETKGEEVGA